VPEERRRSQAKVNRLNARDPKRVENEAFRPAEHIEWADWRKATTTRREITQESGESRRSLLPFLSVSVYRRDSTGLQRFKDKGENLKSTTDASKQKRLYRKSWRAAGRSRVRSLFRKKSCGSAKKARGNKRFVREASGSDGLESYYVPTLKASRCLPTTIGSSTGCPGRTPRL